MSVHTASYKKIKKELGVPEDEPIFIIRGQDDLAMAIVTRYRNMAAQIENGGPDQDWFEQLDNVISEFGAFRIQHPDELKIPD